MDCEKYQNATIPWDGTFQGVPWEELARGAAVGVGVLGLLMALSLVAVWLVASEGGDE